MTQNSNTKTFLYTRQISFQEGRVWIPINRFNPTTFWCLSRARTQISNIICHGFFIPPQRSCRGVFWFHHVRLQTNPMSYDNLSCVSQNLLTFYQLFTDEERRIPFIFDDFHFCRSRVIGLDMTENRMFTLCRMIT